MKVFMRVHLLVLLFTCQSLIAVEVDRLYEAEVIANSELEEDRTLAIRQALDIVLTRILAGGDVHQNATVQGVLENAEHYVSEFQYALVASEKQKNTNARLIRVLFNEKLLVDVFRPSKLDFWNEIRTSTLVWLVVEEKPGQQRFFDASLMPDIDAAISKAAQLKKLPILYPMQDLIEKQSLTISDVLSAYSDHLMDVSQRYDVVSTLAGKMDNSDGCWKAEWTYYFNAQIEQWRSQCGSINDVVLNGFQGVYDRLSNYYAVKSDLKDIDSVNLNVSNINDMTALGWVRDYLSSLPMIKTVTWINANSGYKLYRIFYQGDRSELIKLLQKDDVIRAEDNSQQNVGVMKYKLLTE